MVQDTDTSGLTFLPAADEDLSAADELANVFTDPEDALDVDLETQLPPRIPFGRTWQFDFGSRRLVRYGQRPAMVSGRDALRQWIERVLNIEMGAHTIFPDNWGVEDLHAGIGYAADPALESNYENHVRLALLKHDRITRVDGFQFDLSDDDTALTVTFVVTTDDEDQIDMSSNFPLTGGDLA